MPEPRQPAAGASPPPGAAPGFPPGPRPRDPGAGGRTHRAARRQVRLRRWGALPGRSGVLLVVCGTAAGGAATVLTGGTPGTMLGVFLIAATIAGALAVRPDAARLIIPAPALAYSGAAVIAGLIHDRAIGASRTALALGAVQWAANGFLLVSIATVLAIAITAARRRHAQVFRDARRQPGSSRTRARTG